jgi:hypothetical protein
LDRKKKEKYVRKNGEFKNFGAPLNDQTSALLAQKTYSMDSRKCP